MYIKTKLFFLLLAFIFSVQFAKAQASSSKDCATQHTGDFGFINASKSTLEFKVLYCYMPAEGQYPSFKSTTINFSLKPGESKYLYNVMISPGIRNNFVAKASNTVVNEGDFITEECKTRTLKIK